MYLYIPYNTFYHIQLLYMDLPNPELLKQFSYFDLFIKLFTDQTDMQ